MVYEIWENGNVAKALVEGTFKEPGAAAITWSYDSHNLLVMGNNEEDMELAQKRGESFRGLCSVCRRESWRPRPSSCRRYLSISLFLC